MREIFVMGISELATVWYMVQTLSGLPQLIGYAFGIVLGSWVFDVHFGDGDAGRRP